MLDTTLATKLNLYKIPSSKNTFFPAVNLSWKKKLLFHFSINFKCKRSYFPIPFLVKIDCKMQKKFSNCNRLLHDFFMIYFIFVNLLPDFYVKSTIKAYGLVIVPSRNLPKGSIFIPLCKHFDNGVSVWFSFSFSFFELGVVGVVDDVCVSVGIIVDEGIFSTKTIKT